MPLPAIALGISAGSSLVSGVMSIFGGLSANKAAKAAARRQKLIGRMNAADARRRAADALDRGEQAVRANNRKNLALIGTQKVGLGASYRSLTYGSGAKQVEVSRYFWKLDSETIRKNARQESEGLQHEARMHRMGGQVAAAASRAQGIGDLLSGIGGGLRSVGDISGSAYDFFKKA